MFLSWISIFFVFILLKLQSECTLLSSLLTWWQRHVLCDLKLGLELVNINIS